MLGCLVCKPHEILSVLVLLIIQSLHSTVHVNCKGNNDVQADNNSIVVKYDEEVAIPHVSTFNVDHHRDNNIPIVDHNQNKECDVRG